ncbi:MAG: hypothetical protein ACHQAY_28445 [Hyphomicrobiales bacterium]
MKERSALSTTLGTPTSPRAGYRIHTVFNEGKTGAAPALFDLRKVLQAGEGQTISSPRLAAV